MLSSQNLNGRVVILPCLNPTGFRNNNRVGPESSVSTELQDYILEGLMNISRKVGILDSSISSLNKYKFKISEDKSLKINILEIAQVD